MKPDSLIGQAKNSPPSILHCPVSPAAMSRPLHLFISLLLLLFWMDPSAQKVFLVETIGDLSGPGQAGVDFQEVPSARSQHYPGKCPGCTGKCKKNVKNGLFGSSLSFLGSSVSYSCESQALPPTPPPPPPAPPTTQKPVTCVRTPRNKKRTTRYHGRWNKRQRGKRNQNEPWGFWTSLRDFDGNSFCCSRGPRSGSMVRTPRECGRTWEYKRKLSPKAKQCTMAWELDEPPIKSNQL